MLRSAFGLLALVVCATSQAANRTWVFDVRLDGKLVGMHRFTVNDMQAAREVTSSAGFDIRVLGIVVYRYVHSAQERWEGDCLSRLQSRTDDNGDRIEVHARASEGMLDVRRDGLLERAAGCVMTFAYWNPAMRMQSRLLNPQTGRLEPVQIIPAGDGSVGVRGRDVAARRWRIHAPAQQIDVWYARDDDAWIGLDATLANGRNLSYRIP